MKEKKLKAVKDLRSAPYNPRRVSPEALRGLGASLRNFGDISGIVWNARTGHLVAGHQRVEALRKEHGDALRIEEGALVSPDGGRYPIRVVDWDDATEKAANVAANSPLLQGEFEQDALETLLREIRTEITDFEELRLSDYLPPEVAPYEPNQEPEFHNRTVVTGEEIEKTESGLPERFRRGERDLVDVICPYCSKEFGVAKNDLR